MATSAAKSKNCDSSEIHGVLRQLRKNELDMRPCRCHSGGASFSQLALALLRKAMPFVFAHGGVGFASTV